MNYLETVSALIVMRCDMILQNMGIPRSLEDFPTLSTLAASPDERDIMDWAEDEGSDESRNYFRIVNLLHDDRILQSLLDLTIAVFEFPETAAYLTRFFGHSANLRLAFLMEGILFPDEGEVKEKAEILSAVFELDKRKEPLSYVEITADEKLMLYLHGVHAVNPFLSDITVYYRADKKKAKGAAVNKDLIEEGSALFKSKAGVLQLSGRGGRRFIASRIADGTNRDFLFINIRDFIYESGKDNFLKYRDSLIREAILDEAGICFYGISESFINSGRTAGDPGNRRDRDLELLERRLFIPITEKKIPLILCTDHMRPLLKTIDPGSYRNLRLPENPDLDERRLLWENALKEYKADFDPETLSLKYRLNASEISRVMRSFSEIKGRGSSAPDENTVLSRVCIEELMDGKEAELGRVLFPDTRLDDVQVKSNVRNILNDVVASVNSCALIFDKWKLKKAYPYGRCVSLLMSGPPGTGKTMTANAIAGELSLPLYQVNLSNIVDKYIGETEKNLERVFRYAEKSNSILFFDEADALFGTSSEVHDSKDRYANTEISYLLQRIEAYDGIVILATNIKGNIDPAFMRRIRYVVHFENPDLDMRREIWRRLITDDIPHGEIDLEYLASQFDEFTGSTIKGVFLNACSRAAGLEEPLDMKHFVHAIKHELEKGSPVGFSVDSLGKYAYLL